MTVHRIRCLRCDGSGGEIKQGKLLRELHICDSCDGRGYVYSSSQPALKEKMPSARQ